MSNQKSNLIHISLKPFVKEVKSYVRDSTDFLNKCQRVVSSVTKIVTFDVPKLYVNISHDLGLEPKNYFPTTYRENLHPGFKKEFVIESLEFILKNNIITFDSRFFL